MLVLRELAYGPRRFSELKSDLVGNQRERADPASDGARSPRPRAKDQLPPPASVQVYEATPWGLEVVPLIASLGRWAARSPWHDPKLQMSHVSVMMSLQTLISPALAEGLDTRIGFQFGDTSYVATVRNGRLDVDRQR